MDTRVERGEVEELCGVIDVLRQNAVVYGATSDAGASDAAREKMKDAEYRLIAAIRQLKEQRDEATKGFEYMLAKSKENAQTVASLRSQLEEQRRVAADREAQLREVLQRYGQ